MKNFGKKVWLECMYIAGRDHGHDIISEQHDIEFVALEREIFKYLMECESYRKYSVAVENKSKQAAQRVWYVAHGREHE